MAFVGGGLYHRSVDRSCVCVRSGRSSFLGSGIVSVSSSSMRIDPVRVRVLPVRMELKFADEETKLSVKTKEIFMPALSSTMTEGRIVQWLKQPGDFVEVGEIIMVVESDKADMDVESFEEGYLAQVLTEEGNSASVGATVALLAEKKEDIEKVIDCGTECIVPGSNHRHDGTTVVDTPEPKTASIPAPAPGPASTEKPKGVKEIFMPALSSTMTEGKIVQWLKKEGDPVAVGESVMVVESDKADMDVESFEEGVLAHIVNQEGESTSVGASVAYIAASAAEVAAVKAWAEAQGSGVSSAPVESSSVPAAAATPAAAPAPTPVASTPATGTVINEGRIIASPLAKKLAAEMGVNLQFVKGTGPGNRIVAKDIENAKSAGVSAAPAAPAAPAPTTYKSTRVFATPDAKKVAKTENIKLETVVGSGNFGRITAEDVLRAAGKATVPKSEVKTVPKQKVAKTEKASAKKVEAPGAAQDGPVPMTGKQKAVAKRMTATLTIPSYSISYEIRTKAFDALYAKVKSKGVTVSSLLAKAVATVVQKHPIMNSRYEPDTIVYKKAADIAVAVATPDGGLVTPVLRSCEAGDIYSISRSWKELVGKAMDGGLSSNEISGSHFFLSNLGMFGVDSFQAILPVKTGTILAISASKPKVVMQDNGLIGVEKVMKVSATCDHRVIQGAQCADFLRDLADFIENRIDDVMY